MTPGTRSSTASTRSPTRSRSRSARRAATSCWTRSFGAPTITNDGVTIAKEIELSTTRTRTSARSWSRRSRPRPTTSPATAPPPPPCWPRRWCEGLRNVAAGANPTSLKRGMDAAVAAVNEALLEQGDRGRRRRGDRARRHHLGAGRHDRRADRRGDGQGRPRRRHHRRGGLDDGDRARGHRGHAVRQGLHLAALRHRPGGRRGRARRPLHPDHHAEDQRDRGAAAAAGEGPRRPASRC